MDSNAVKTETTGGELVQIPKFLYEMRPEIRESFINREYSRPERQEEIDRKASEAAQRAEERARDVRRQQIRAGCGLKGAQWENTFRAYIPNANYPAQREAVRIAELFVSKLPGVKRGLALWGPTGTGKSHLATAVAIAAMAKDDPVSVLYIDCITLDDQLRRHARVKSEPSLLEKCQDVRLVVLDDIEKALAGDAAPWVGAFVKELTNAAEQHGNPLLLVTSEFPVEPVAGQDPSRCHKAHLPEWFACRLGKLMHWQHIDGENYRRRQAREAGFVDEDF